MSTLFIFRRDLRLNDNTGLNFALEQGKPVILCFIFTPEQIDENRYRSDCCLQFMIESIEDLEEAINKLGARLYLFYGDPEVVVEKIIHKQKIDTVVVNRDYTPYSQLRDRKIASVCKKNKVAFNSFDDALLNAPEESLKSDGKPYAIFTPYYRNASKIDVKMPQAIRKGGYYTKSIEYSESKSLYKKILPHRNGNPWIKGGRKAALKILKGIEKFEDYATSRDIPSEDATTHLSAYLKFTNISPREVYHAIAEKLGTHHELIRALYWRDFFSHLAFFFPHVFKGAFHPKYNQLKWSDDKKAFKLWCEGRTGFPIVDAGMRQLNETGFMHNRVRMIVASFLTKDLHINWRWGEKYFAQKLIDYDPAVNNGNWQWVASTGADAQPYFRIFNPWNQQKKFDPDCVYIKEWVPELKNYSTKSIHGAESCIPMVDHALEAKEALKAYSACK